MILPMKKVCLVVQDKNQTEALTKLREIGIMHLEATKALTDNLAKAIDKKMRTENAFALIQPFKTPKKKAAPQTQTGGGRERRRDTGPRRGRRASDKLGIEELEPYSVDAVNAPERPNLTELMIGMGDERRVLEEQYAGLLRERGRIAGWGEINPQDIKDLASSGVNIYFYELSTELFRTIPHKTRFIKINGDKSVMRIMVLHNAIPNMNPFQLSAKPLSQLDAEIAGLKTKLDSLNQRIESFADRRPVLDREMAEINSEITFEMARAELEKVDVAQADLGFSYVTGFVPAEDMGKLKAAAAENNWALTADDPGEEDPTPTKLKNNSFTQLLTPLTGFLDLVPGYREVDISLWFLIYITIFFGMLFGDAGYGLLIFMIAVIGIIKTLKTGVPVIFKMICLFSISNILWGMFTCTWFGIDIAVLPQFLKDVSLPWISPAKGLDQVTINQNMQFFCFSLAISQLSIGRIGGIIRGIRRRNLKLFADIGVLGMLWGMYNLVLFLVVSSSRFPLLPASLYLLGGGFILNFIFGNYEGNVLQSILNGLKNIISVILGVSGVFSDIMSYIRLWAVGLAGAALAETFNNLAGPMLGSFLFFFGIIILAFGHGLNLILNVLAILVHGVRLNILEFSGHVGLTWSGIAYKPFAETAKK